MSSRLTRSKNIRIIACLGGIFLTALFFHMYTISEGFAAKKAPPPKGKQPHRKNPPFHKPNKPRVNTIKRPPMNIPGGPKFLFEFAADSDDSNLTNSVTGKVHQIFNTGIQANQEVVNGYCRFANTPDGVSYINIYNCIPLGQSFSMSFWINIRGINNQVNLIRLDNYDKPSHPNEEVIISLIEIDPLLRIISNNVLSDTPLTANLWQHLFFTFSRSGNTLTCNSYTDGAPNPSLNYTMEIDPRISGSDVITDAVIGGTNVGPANSSLYYINNYRHYDYALTESQVSDVFKKGDGVRPVIA